uniref:Uncharacterized protein n=1 Tax=Meloidogyne javanica TaxID=6303 RepID=A0A915NG45_MELJA
MSGIEEDSFDFPEFLEKENCLPASNSSTTSSVFGTLTNASLLQSTSQQSAEKIQKPEFLKCSHNLHKSGSRAISPIIEPFREDMDKLVNDGTSDKIVQNLVTRFENLFDHFERKQRQLNANWENFHKEMAKFNQQKIHEWAKIVDIRFGLQRDEYNAKAEKDSDRVKELELELIHAKIKLLEGKVDAFGKSFKEDNTKIKDYNEILDSSEVNTMYILTERGREFTFKNGNEEIIVVELSGCGHQYCLLYEFQTKLIGENDHLNESKYKYFRWTTVPRLPLSQSNLQIQKIELHRFNTTKAVKVEIPVESFPGDHVEFWLRVDNPLVIEHVRMEKGICGQKELEDELICRENELAGAQQENTSLRSELSLMKRQNQPFPASQYNLQKNKNETHKTNFSVSRDTQLNVFRSTQRSSRLDSLPKNSVSTFNNNTTSTSSDKTFLRRSNSVTSLNTQYKQQANNSTEEPENLFPAPRNHTTFNNMELSLNQQFDLPSKMVRTKYQRTSHGKQYTFSDGNNEIIVVKSALCCQPPYNRQCLLYEFQPKSTCKNKNLDRYLENGKAYRKCDANQWDKEEFLPNIAKMSVRRDGSYSTLYNQLHRFNTTKVVNLIIPVESVPGSNLQIFLCCDNVIIVKHFLSKDGIYGQKKLAVSRLLWQ